MTALPALPKPNQQIQCLIFRRYQTVTVKTVFANELQIIGKVEGPSQDPRGSWIVADLQGSNGWVFRHSLSPEQAGEPPLTEEQRAELHSRIQAAQNEAKKAIRLVEGG
jgi:hypothetical protein